MNKQTKILLLSALCIAGNVTTVHAQGNRAPKLGQSKRAQRTIRGTLVDPKGSELRQLQWRSTQAASKRLTVVSPEALEAQAEKDEEARALREFLASPVDRDPRRTPISPEAKSSLRKALELAALQRESENSSPCNGFKPQQFGAKASIAFKPKAHQPLARCWQSARQRLQGQIAWAKKVLPSLCLNSPALPPAALDGALSRATLKTRVRKLVEEHKQLIIN